jgi:hypothetical protein
MRWVAAMAVLVSGCVHHLALAPQEQCATRGMYLEGLSMSSGTTSGYATGGGVSVYGRANSYDESVSCRRAKTVEEKCEVFAANASLNSKTTR